MWSQIFQLVPSSGEEEHNSGQLPRRRAARAREAGGSAAVEISGPSRGGGPCRCDGPSPEPGDRGTSAPRRHRVAMAAWSRAAPQAEKPGCERDHEAEDRGDRVHSYDSQSLPYIGDVRHSFDGTSARIRCCRVTKLSDQTARGNSTGCRATIDDDRRTVAQQSGMTIRKHPRAPVAQTGTPPPEVPMQTTAAAATSA